MLALALAAALAAPAVTGELVRAVRVERDRERLLPFVAVAPGQLFDPEAVRRSVELIFATGRYEDVRVELVRDRDTDAPFPAAAKFTSAVVTECLARDMWVYPAGSGPVQDGVMIGCPFIITEAEIEQIVVTLRDGIDAAARAV